MAENISQVGEDPVSEALKLYPILQNLNLSYKINPTPNRGFLEFYPPNEPGSPQYPRPKELPIEKIGLEIFDNKTRPIDVLGDITSHWLIYNDPFLKKQYELFTESLTPEQKQRLKDQYLYAQKNFNEERPYDQWEQMSGLPGYFRGYTFQQWEPDVIKKAYTLKQIDQLNNVLNYLKSNMEIVDVFDPPFKDSTED